MKLREYLQKYRITRKEFSQRVGVSDASIYNYLFGRKNPTQKIAERIEKESDGLVTVFELRGKDARIK